MAGQNVDENLGLGLSLGGLYQQGRTAEVLEDRAMSMAGDLKEENAPPPEKLAVRHQPRAISMPTFRELHEMNSNMKGVENLTMCLASESKKLTAGDQKELTDKKGASVLLRGLLGGATYGTGSGRVAASSSTVASEISSSDGSGEQSRDMEAMVISTKKKVTADEETELDTPAKRARVFNCNNNVVWRAGMARMPSVNTTGTDGKKVEGFLYKYLDAPVSIVCVCHGNFFSPAEFINHAGGEKVANPLKKISVVLYK